MTYRIHGKKKKKEGKASGHNYHNFFSTSSTYQGRRERGKKRKKRGKGRVLRFRHQPPKKREKKGEGGVPWGSRTLFPISFSGGERRKGREKKRVFVLEFEGEEGDIASQTRW